MVEPTIPITPEEITPEWLTHALRESEILVKATVESVDIEAVGEGRGALSQIVRLNITYDHYETHAPESLIAKLSLPDPEMRKARTSIYANEIHFYRELANRMNLYTPRLYFSAMRDEEGLFILLLEDLSALHPIGQTGCWVEETKCAVTHLTLLHAQFWGDPHLKRLEWLSDWNPVVYEGQWQAFKTRTEEHWTVFKDKMGHRLSAQIMKIGDHLAEYLVYVTRQLEQLPRTLIHGDFDPNNLLFGAVDGPTPIAVIDWQFLEYAPGVLDMSRFLSDALSPQDLTEHETMLLENYHAGLMENGVEGYDFDQCLRAYRLSVLKQFCHAVSFASRLDSVDENARRRLESIIHSKLTIVDRSNIEELLPSNASIFKQF